MVPLANAQVTLVSWPEMSTDEQPNTVAMLGQAYSLLGFQIVEGVVGAGYPQKPKHSAVFAQIPPRGPGSPTSPGGRT